MGRDRAVALLRATYEFDGVRSKQALRDVLALARKVAPRKPRAVTKSDDSSTPSTERV